MARMTRIALSTFESIRNVDSGLFQALLEAAKAEKTGGPIVVDYAYIRGESFKQAWDRWKERNPSLILSKDDSQDELWQAEQAAAIAAKQAADEAAVKRAAEEAGKHYHQYWVNQRGLVDSPRTRGIIIDEMERVQKRDGAVPSAKLVDIVIERLQAQGVVFEWKSAEPAPAAPVEPPAPPVILSDGSEQKPLSAIPSSSWTVVQLQDWDRRTREARSAAIRIANNEVAQAFAGASTSTLEVEI